MNSLWLGLQASQLLPTFVALIEIFRVVNNYLVKLLFVLTLFSCENRFSKYAIPNLEEVRAYDQDKADAFVRENLKKYPDNLELVIHKLKMLKEREWPIGSNSEIRDAIKLDSLNTTILELAADLYVNRNEFERALTFASRAEKYGSNSASFYQLKSQVYNGKGEYDRAIDYINKAILINRSDYESYYTKGKIYLSFGDTLSALRFMNIGLANNRNNYRTLYEVSDIYEKTGQYEQAELLIDKAISYAPQNEKLRLKKADIYINQDKIEDAKEVLRASFEEDSTRLESAMKLGNIHYKLLNYDSTILVMEKISSVDSLNMGALSLKAKSYDMRGLYTSAINTYEQILSVDSLYEDAKTERDKVIRKRAYLQKIKEEREAVPTFDFFIPKIKETI